MLVTSSTPKVSLGKIFERIFAFRQITRIDQRLLMSAFLRQDLLSEKDYMEINRIFQSLQRGNLTIVD